MAVQLLLALFLGPVASASPIEAGWFFAPFPSSAGEYLGDREPA